MLGKLLTYGLAAAAGIVAWEGGVKTTLSYVHNQLTPETVMQYKEKDSITYIKSVRVRTEFGEEIELPVERDVAPRRGFIIYGNEADRAQQLTQKQGDSLNVTTRSSDQHSLEGRTRKSD